MASHYLRLIVPFFFAYSDVESFSTLPTNLQFRSQLQHELPLLLPSNFIPNNVGVGSPTALQLSPLDVMVTMYKDSLYDNPLETKLITGGILAFLGDAIAQSNDKGYDQKRAAALVSFDIVYRAVQCALFPYITSTCDGHYIGSLLTNVVPQQSLDPHVLATIEQTCFNQFLVIPIIYYPVFFTLTGWVQGLTREATMERVENTIVPLLARNWAFWIPVQYFQFGYVDEPLQIPFLCAVGLAWTFILSSAAGSTKGYGDEQIAEGEQVVAIATQKAERVPERVPERV
jgi:protein Mpv17